MACRDVAADRTLEARCVVPGLINSHVHLEVNGEPDTQTFFIIRSEAERTLDAARNARLSLEAGVTTVRDLGGSGSNAVILREAIAAGDHVGPTIIAAGRAICMTGGHGFFLGREADGPWDTRKAVREQRKAGATCIKLIATGGVLTRGAVVGQDQLSEEEMRAAVSEAATHGLRVAAHAIGTNGIKNALRAGVTSIEHGCLLDDEAIALFLERKTYLVPTLAAPMCINDNAASGKQPEYVIRKSAEITEKMAENVGRAWRAGVPIAGGSDAGTPYNYHQSYAYEVELLVRLIGLTPQQALTAATATAGELLGVEAGVLAPGRPADLLLIDGDAGADPRALREPHYVIKGGDIAFRAGVSAVDLRGLRVAVLGTIAWPSPPPGYGPWEQVASDIANGMAARGLDVTLFASGNSKNPGHLASVVPVGLNEDPALNGDVFSELNIASCFARASEFDVIHNSSDWKTAALRTRDALAPDDHHGARLLDTAGPRRVLCGSETLVSSARSATRDRDPGLEYLATTYNGVDTSAWTYRDTPGDYLLYLARFHPEKGAHRAIAVAQRAGVRLKIAGIPQDTAYFDEAINPTSTAMPCSFWVTCKAKHADELVGRALALVHLTTRPERFGLTLIEAMACGTPILGARMGSIPEIVVDGVTGFLCDDDEDAVGNVPHLGSLSRSACREHVETTFSVDRMVDRYLDAYAAALERKMPSPPTDDQLTWRRHDWWDRPMAFTDMPPRPDHAPETF